MTHPLFSCRCTLIWKCVYEIDWMYCTRGVFKLAVTSLVKSVILTALGTILTHFGRQTFNLPWQIASQSTRLLTLYMWSHMYQKFVMTNTVMIHWCKRENKTNTKQTWRCNTLDQNDKKNPMIGIGMLCTVQISKLDMFVERLYSAETCCTSWTISFFVLTVTWGLNSRINIVQSKLSKYTKLRVTPGNHFHPAEWDRPKKRQILVPQITRASVIKTDDGGDKYTPGVNIFCCKKCRE